MATERRPVGDHISSGKVVAMGTEAKGKISRAEYAPQSHGLRDRRIHIVSNIVFQLTHNHRDAEHYW